MKISKICNGDELVLIAAVLGIKLCEGLTVDEINTVITFLVAVSNNMSVIVSCRDPEAELGPV